MGSTALRQKQSIAVYSVQVSLPETPINFTNMPHKQSKINSDLVNLPLPQKTDRSNEIIMTSDRKNLNFGVWSSQEPETPNLEVMPSQNLMGNKYFDESQTYLQSDKLIRSQEESNILRDVYEATQKSGKSKAALNFQIDEASESEPDLVDIQDDNNDDYTSFDWRSVKPQVYGKTKNNSPMINLVNNLIFEKINQQIVKTPRGQTSYYKKKQ